MRKKIFLAGLVAAMFGFYTQVNAQVTATLPLNYVSKTTSAVDTVTVGSIMPYQVTGDVNFHALRKQGLFDFSDFTWGVTGGTSGTNFQLREKTGVNTIVGSKDTVVSVQWILAGAYQVTVKEVPVPASGMPAITCSSTTENLDVLVVARPTAAWNTPNTGGCSIAGTTVNIPVDLTGTGQYDITYKIDYTNLSGTTTNKVATGTVATVGSYQAGSQSINLTYAVPSSEYGVYTVTIESLSDRISRKSGIANIASDIPATTFKIYSYPAPVTNPIQHIRNL